MVSLVSLFLYCNLYQQPFRKTGLHSELLNGVLSVLTSSEMGDVIRLAPILLALSTSPLYVLEKGRSLIDTNWQTRDITIPKLVGVSAFYNS